MRLALIALLACSSGCTLLTKSEPLQTTFISPPLPAAKPQASGAPASGELPLLRVRRVSAAAHLRQPVLMATGPYASQTDEELHWADEPVGYLSRGLSRVLYEGGPYRRALGANAPVLEVELTRFEVGGTLESAQAIVEVHVLLHDGEHALLEASYRASAALADPRDPSVLAKAMGKALADALEQTLRGIRRE